MYPKAFKKLIAHFSSLPSVGPKMAERLTLHLFKESRASILDFSDGIRALVDLRACSECFHIAEDSLCAICADSSRDRTLLAVVEEPMDVIAIERTGSYRGHYFVLGGTLDVSPKKQNEDGIRIAELLDRIRKNRPKEVILALNPTAEGDMTALYLRRKLADESVVLSRLGRGLSTGGDIEYADESTLGSAITRRETFA